MTSERKLLEAQLADQQKAMHQTKDRLEALARAEADARLGPLKALAERAHDLLCPYNHTDGCSWGYETGSTGEWQGSAHNRWLTKIDKLVTGGPYEKPTATVEEITLVLDAVEGLKPKVRTALDLLRRGLMP